MISEKYIAKILNYTLILTALISFLGAVVYRIHKLNTAGIITALFMSAAFFVFFLFLEKKHSTSHHKKHEKNLNTNKPQKQITIHYLLFTIYCLLATISFYILAKYQTAAAIISPWQVIPNYFFIIFAAATTLLIIIFTQRNYATNQSPLRGIPPSLKNNRVAGLFNYLTISTHYLLTFTIAVIIYKLGYGFDPHVHEATMNLIDKTGAVDPKPFYYLGQYSLIIIAHKLTAIPIFWLRYECR